MIHYRRLQRTRVEAMLWCNNRGMHCWPCQVFIEGVEIFVRLCTFRLQPSVSFPFCMLHGPGAIVPPGSSGAVLELD